MKTKAHKDKAKKREHGKREKEHSSKKTGDSSIEDSNNHNSNENTENVNNVNNVNNNNNSDNEHDQDHHHDHDTDAHTKDDGNVEAAVMKYVGGTLESRKGSSSSKRKRSFTNDEINEFQHWNAFLNTEQLQQSSTGADDESTQQQQQSIGSTGGPSAKHQNKKKRKRDAHGNHINVDPELAQLDDTAEHEQLVRAAILDANQLAQDVNIHDYIQPTHDSDEKYSQISHHTLDSNIIQAAQVAAAAQQQLEQQQSGQVQNQGHDENDNISSHTQPVQGQRHPDLRAPQNHQQPSSELATLVAAAATKASSWVQNQSQGKMFSKEEIEAIDKFIVDYCNINNMTRRQLCERVWSNERKKDDFWESIHKVLPYRTRASIYKHVRRSYHIFEVRGKWTPDEDAILGRLAAEKDGQWKLIGQEMGRMPEDCRDRWRNYVKCGNNRAQNKWSTEEEDKLKQVIGQIIEEQRGITGAAINWTVVSEKMGGSRSRIQCRYKWNKLLKRDALARAQTIDIADRVWLLNKLQELRFVPEDNIDWNTLASLHPKNYWTGADFKICYEKMRSAIRDFKKKSVVEISNLLLQDLIQDANRNNIDIEPPLDPTRKQESENLASAAVNAVSNSNQNNPEEYIWR